MNDEKNKKLINELRKWFNYFKELPQGKKIIIRIFIFIITNILFTCFIIIIHTPKLSNINFGYFCKDNNVDECKVDITEDKKRNFEIEISKSVDKSHRLGKLSDIYLSLIKFNVYFLNKTETSLLIIKTNKTINNLKTEIVCRDNKTIFKQNLIKIDTKFALSYESNGLLKIVEAFLEKCNAYRIDDLSVDEDIIKNHRLINDTIIKSQPIIYLVLKTDLLSWILVFLFNILIISGLLPIIKNVLISFVKGYSYYFLSEKE
jgi:hypothetical protein